jgi:hypothetical protein
MRSRKAFAVMELIIWIALLVLSGFLIITMWTNFVSKAEPAAAEKLCEAFNAARAATQVEKAGFLKFNVIPDACKPIDLGAIPQKGYPETAEGAKANIAKLTTKCWDMYLKGTKPNIFASWGISGLSNAPCQTCYTFTLKKGIKFSMADLENYIMNTNYLVEDSSNRCALTDTGYSGGYCRQTCNSDEKEASSASTKRCLELGKNGKCCIQKDSKNECQNKGGICKVACDEMTEKPYIAAFGWKCPENQLCCVGSKDYYSYLDYIQFYGGSGAVAAPKEMNFVPLQQYAIAFVSPQDKRFTWDSVFKVTVTAAGAVAAGVFLTPMTGVAVATAGTYWVSQSAEKVKDHTSIIEIMPLEFVSTTCNLQPSAGGK